MSQISLRIRVFGMLRNYSDRDGFIDLGGVSRSSLDVQSLKNVLKDYFKVNHPHFESDLINECAVANQSEVLQDHAFIGIEDEIAVLPPVCGG
jgi:hypothetical protein